MTTISEAFLAFYDALDRIEAVKREPTPFEDRTLRSARGYVRHDPAMAVRLLRTVPDASGLSRPQHGTAVVRTIGRWREDLRKLD